MLEIILKTLNAVKEKPDHARLIQDAADKLNIPVSQIAALLDDNNITFNNDSQEYEVKSNQFKH